MNSKQMDERAYFRWFLVGHLIGTIISICHKFDASVNYDLFRNQSATIWNMKIFFSVFIYFRKRQLFIVLGQRGEGVKTCKRCI